MGNALCCGLRTDMGPAPEIPPAEVQRQREDEDYQSYLRQQQRRDQYSNYPSNPQRSSSYGPPRRQSTYGYGSYEMQPNGQPGQPQYPQASPQLHPQYGGVLGSPQQYAQGSPQLHPRYSVQGVSPQLHPRYSQHVPGTSPSPQMHPYSQSPNMYSQSPNASPHMGAHSPQMVPHSPPIVPHSPQIGAQGGYVPGAGGSPMPEQGAWRNPVMKESPKQVRIFLPRGRLWLTFLRWEGAFDAGQGA